MKNLDGISDPYFKCAIFRRSHPELKRQGGLIDESGGFYTPFGGEYKKQAMVWEFPSGASIAFNSIASDSDLGGWQGAQFTRVLVDEAADKWTQKQVLFLLSRIRSAHSKIHPQLILTCNPDRQSFLYNWVEFCLDPETGVPYEGTENRVRWFVVIDNTVLWADGPEECYELHGKSRNLIYARGISEEEIEAMTQDEKNRLFIPKSFRFIPTGVYDNKYLLPPRNNSYLANLLSQPRVNQLKFLHGSWTAREEGAGYWKREWCKEVDQAPRNVVACVRSWDLASSEPTSSTPNPDWTAGVRLSRDKLGHYYVENVIRFQKLTNAVLEEIIKTAQIDGIGEVEVTLPKDSGGGGKAANLFFVRALSEHGITTRSIQMSGHSSKLNRFLPFAALCEAGSVSIVKGDWNEAFYQELENFIPNNRNQKDD